MKDKYLTILKKEISSYKGPKDRKELSSKSLSSIFEVGYPDDANKFSKRRLFELVKEAETDDQIIKLCCSIMAWGGMRKNNAKSFYEERSEWLVVAKKILKGDINRQSAYQEFYELRRGNKLKGIGPAFYTKLIFFLMTKTRTSGLGYIMDQWTASSVNLLSENQIVIMNVNLYWSNKDKYEANFTVSDVNLSINYENFCLELEKISTELGVSPCSLERILMYNKSRLPEADQWRTVVKLERFWAYLDVLKTLNRHD